MLRLAIMVIFLPEADRLWPSSKHRLSIGKGALPANDLVARMFLRPSRDLAGRDEHALDEQAFALQVEALFATHVGRSDQTNRQYEVDHFHPGTLPRHLYDGARSSRVDPSIGEFRFLEVPE
jgi:hypothetical protein